MSIPMSVTSDRLRQVHTIGLFFLAATKYRQAPTKAKMEYTKWRV